MLSHDTTERTGTAAMPAVREATPADIPAIREIEQAAGEMFRSVGMDEIADDEAPPPEKIAIHVMSGHAWVAVDENDHPIGYLLVKIVDANPYIEQVSVHPDYARQGVGRKLIDRVAEWAQQNNFSMLTLSTFEHVPWNAPYYERLGFHRLGVHEIGKGLSNVLEDEEEAGLRRWDRVFMGKPLERKHRSF